MSNINSIDRNIEPTLKLRLLSMANAWIDNMIETEKGYLVSEVKTEEYSRTRVVVNYCRSNNLKCISPVIEEVEFDDYVNAYSDMGDYPPESGTSFSMSEASLLLASGRLVADELQPVDHSNSKIDYSDDNGPHYF